MGSTRFPGKVLADLDDEPMLLFMLKRLGLLEKHHVIDHLVVATTDLPEDDVIRDLCHGRGIYCYRGDSEDVLSRFMAVAGFFKADTIIRLTADCPLVWAGLVEYALERFTGGYAMLRGPDGMDVEVLDYASLQKAYDGAHGPIYESYRGSWQRHDREHVTSYLEAERQWIEFPKLSVDTPEDLERVKEFLGA